ncbi:MAG: 4Fe-4S binding protein [Actinobacteria bacterium]|nr:4Fe-4S binding protein [Actinomycetota bacterium]
MREKQVSQARLASKDPARIKRGIDTLDALSRLARVPGMRLHPWMRHDRTDIRWLPINRDIELPGDTPVPLAILEMLIGQASHRVIHDICGCRTGCGCERHPHDIGCLLMGDSAIESDPDTCREVDVVEALEHARRAVETGLVPVVGKVRVDNTIFGIKERRRLLTVCFCCDCCCITRFTRHTPVRHLESLFPRLDGISVSVNEKCDGCGDCVDRCYIGAIRMVEKKAVIGERCRACGRCATVCPRDAVRVSIDDPAFAEKAIERIRAHVKYD